MDSSGVYVITNGGDPRDYNCLSSCEDEVCGYLSFKHCPLYFSRESALEVLETLSYNIRKHHRVVEANTLSLLVFRPEALVQKEVQKMEESKCQCNPSKRT